VAGRLTLPDDESGFYFELSSLSSFTIELEDLRF